MKPKIDSMTIANEIYESGVGNYFALETLTGILDGWPDTSIINKLVFTVAVCRTHIKRHDGILRSTKATWMLIRCINARKVLYH